MDTKKRHSVESVRIRQNRLQLVVDGKVYEYELGRISERLANANKVQRDMFDVSPSGYGIRWPLIDEDLSIDGLLRISTSNPGPSPSRARTDVKIDNTCRVLGFSPPRKP